MNTKQKSFYEDVLSRIPQTGWTEVSFTAAARKARITLKEAHTFFPGGILGIVAMFQDEIDATMDQAIASNKKFERMRVREKIAYAVRVRLESLEPRRPILRGLIVWSCLPAHLGGQMRRLWSTADKIWLACGDTSTDYNHYTKRLLLIAVMKSTIAFWLNDTSRGCLESWAFLDRRINDVLKIGKGMAVAKTIGLSDMVSILREKFL